MRPNMVHLLCERVIVMRAREIVAQGVCGEVLSTRKADYAGGLLATVPRPPTCCRARRRAVTRDEERRFCLAVMGACLIAGRPYGRSALGSTSVRLNTSTARIASLFNAPTGTALPVAARYPLSPSPDSLSGGFDAHPH
jgi:ABC-type glutathione transport system ATPase component